MRDDLRWYLEPATEEQAQASARLEQTELEAWLREHPTSSRGWFLLTHMDSVEPESLRYIAETILAMPLTKKAFEYNSLADAAFVLLNKHARHEEYAKPVLARILCLKYSPAASTALSAIKSNPLPADYIYHLAQVLHRTRPQDMADHTSTNRQILPYYLLCQGEWPSDMASRLLALAEDNSPHSHEILFQAALHASAPIEYLQAMVPMITQDLLASSSAPSSRVAPPATRLGNLELIVRTLLARLPATSVVELASATVKFVEPCLQWEHWGNISATTPLATRIHIEHGGLDIVETLLSPYYKQRKVERQSMPGLLPFLAGIKNSYASPVARSVYKMSLVRWLNDNKRLLSTIVVSAPDDFLVELYAWLAARPEDGQPLQHRLLEQLLASSRRPWSNKEFTRVLGESSPDIRALGVKLLAVPRTPPFPPQSPAI